jgi:hypothetical protein
MLKSANHLLVEGRRKPARRLRAKSRPVFDGLKSTAYAHLANINCGIFSPVWNIQ